MVKRETVAGVTGVILLTFLTFKLCLSSFPVTHFIWLDVLPYDGFLLIVHFHYPLCSPGIFITEVVVQSRKLCGVNLTCLMC